MDITMFYGFWFLVLFLITSLGSMKPFVDRLASDAEALE